MNRSDFESLLFGAKNKEAILAEFDRMRDKIDELSTQAFTARKLEITSTSLMHDDGEYQTMTVTSIIMTYSDKGDPSYKAVGYPWVKFGVRVWPEVLPLIDVDETTLKPGPNPIPSVRVIVLMGEKGPRKVIGKA